MPRLRDHLYRVIIMGATTAHGPDSNNPIAYIDDAKDIGVSDYANATGEAFFTLPINHPAVSKITPLVHHYAIRKWNDKAGDWRTMGRGLIEDYDATPDEIVWYGHNYKGLLETSVSASSTTYSSQFLGTIVADQLSQAISASNSRLAWTSQGTIEATSKTATLVSQYQARLDFLRSVATVSMADRSVRTLLEFPRSMFGASTWSFTENAGELKNDQRLRYGGVLTDFRYSPGLRDFATRVKGIGVKLEGATILYSEQTNASETTYGRVEVPALFQNIVNQAALDELVKNEARRRNTNQLPQLLLSATGHALDVWDVDVGDQLWLFIKRGPVAVEGTNSFYTVWGWEWTVAPNGEERIYFDLAKSET